MIMAVWPEVMKVNKEFSIRVGMRDFSWGDARPPPPPPHFYSFQKGPNLVINEFLLGSLTGIWVRGYYRGRNDSRAAAEPTLSQVRTQ